MDHIAKQCKLQKSESTAQPKKVSAISSTHTPPTENTPHPLQFLESDSDSFVNVVCVTDHGSHLRRVQVVIAGVPAMGLIDTGADISVRVLNLTVNNIPTDNLTHTVQ